MYKNAIAWRQRNSSAPSNKREGGREGGREGRRLGVARPLQEGRDSGIVLNFKNCVPGA